MQITESFTISEHEFEIAKTALELDTSDYKTLRGFVCWRLECTAERADQILAVARRVLEL